MDKYISGRMMLIKYVLIMLAALMMPIYGYSEAIEQTVVMEIRGMTCPVCPLAVKNSLSKIEGVKDVEVSIEEKKAWLTVEESVTDQILVETLRETGMYKGRVIQRKPANNAN